MKKGSFWTRAKVDRLLNYLERYSGKTDKYGRISRQFRSVVTPNAVYKKLGRMGLLKANWSKVERASNNKKRSLR